MAKQANGTMKDEKQPSGWPVIEARLRDDARRDAPEFPPFLHQRIHAVPAVVVRTPRLPLDLPGSDTVNHKLAELHQARPHVRIGAAL